MKNLFVSFLLSVVSFVSFSQKIIIHVFEKQELYSSTRTTIDSVILNPDTTYEMDTAYRKYILDLNEKTSTYFANGKVVSTLPIDYVELGNNLIKINILEGSFDYGLIINTNYENESVTWFWFTEYDTTVKLFTKFNIEKSS